LKILNSSPFLELWLKSVFLVPARNLGLTATPSLKDRQLESQVLKSRSLRPTPSSPRRRSSKLACRLLIRWSAFKLRRLTTVWWIKSFNMILKTSLKKWRNRPRLAMLTQPRDLRSLLTVLHTESRRLSSQTSWSTSSKMTLKCWETKKQQARLKFRLSTFSPGPSSSTTIAKTSAFHASNSTLLSLT